MHRHDTKNQGAAERTSGKQQRPSAEGQENSSMRTHDLAESSLNPVRLAGKDPLTSHEFQVAHDEHGGVRQKEHPSPSLVPHYVLFSQAADAGAHLEDSTPTSPLPLAAQGNTRERESSNQAEDSVTSAKPNAVVSHEPATTVSQPREITAPTPIRLAHVEIQSAQNTPTDSPHLPSSSKALVSTSQDVVPAPTLKSTTPQSSGFASKKRTTWYGMEVPDNDDPLGPKKAALAATNTSTGSPVMAGSPALSSAASPLAVSSASANPASVQPVRSKVASNMDVLRSHSFSPSQDRPVNIRETIHALDHPVVMKALPAPAEKLPEAFPDSPVIAPADTPVAPRLTTPSVVPVYLTPVASSENLPTFIRPVQSPAAAAHVQDSKAVIPAFSTPTLRHSDLPTTVAAPSVVSYPVVKESTPASRSTIATAATAVVAAAAGVFHKLSDHSEPPIVTPGIKETVAIATVPASQAATLPVKSSTAAALKTPKKDLFLYEEEESTYPRGDEAVKLENPAHPAVIEDVIEVKKLPKEFQSTAAALKMPKKDLSLYDEEESNYPRGDEASQHENPAHPRVGEEIVEAKVLPAEIKAVPMVVDTKELAVSETLIDGTRRGSQPSVKEMVKGAFSGFHMPKMGRKKDEKDAEVEATTMTTTPATEVKPAMAAAVTVPVAATIAAALRDTHDDEPFIEPPHHRLTSAPAVITEPRYHKPAAPLVDEEKSISISARKLEPLSVLPPSGSVMVMDKATITEPAHSPHEVTSHPHIGAAAPVTIAATAAIPITTATTTAVKETSEMGTSTHHPTAAATIEHPTTAVVEHSTVTSTLASAAVGVIPAPVAPVVPASSTETHVHPTETEAHSTPIYDSFKTKASHLAAVVAAPLIAAKDKLTGHHHDDKTTHTTTSATAAIPGSGLHASRRASVEVSKEQTVVEKKVIRTASEGVASKVPHNDDEEVIMIETKTTKTVTTIPPTCTHVYEPGDAAVAAAAVPVAHVEEPAEIAHTGVRTIETHAAKHVEAKPMEVKHVEAKHVEIAKPVEVKHTEVKHEPSSTNSVVAAVTGAASAVAAVFSGRRHSTVSNTDKTVVEAGHEVVPATAAVPHKANEDVVMRKTTSTTTTTNAEPSHVHTTTPVDTHVVKPVVETHVTKAAETVAAAVPVSAAAADSIIHPVDKHHTEGTSVTTEETVVGKVLGTVASAAPRNHDKDVVMVQTTTTTTEVSPAMGVKGKDKHDDYLPVVAAGVPVVVTQTAPKPDGDRGQGG